MHYRARSVAGSLPLTAQVDGQLPPLVRMHKKIHAAPELSHHEENTSALLAGDRFPAVDRGRGGIHGGGTLNPRFEPA